MVIRRSILSVTTAVAVVLAAVPAAQAAADPVESAAADIVATATKGEPLTVVTTVETADGPQVTTVVVDSRKEAVDVVSDQLDESSTVDVEMAKPVSIAAKRTKRVNDRYRKKQWALTRFDAERAWRKSKGKGVKVAVIDTGVTANHPDLRGRVLKGRDFVSGGRNANDRNGHGTHVAGIIAAKANNKRGIAGLAPNARILPVRVLDAAGNGNTGTVAQGIIYSVRKGADIINLSLAAFEPDGATRSAVAYAVRKGVVVVAAAGNAGLPCGVAGVPKTYPAAYPGVLGVGAIDKRGRVPGFSNCGSYVDVVAPGASILSTMTKRSHRSLPCYTGSSYCTLSGTSMAAPYVAASAALLMSRKKKMRASSVRKIITRTAKDIGPRGYDGISGHGVVRPKNILKGR